MLVKDCWSCTRVSHEPHITNMFEGFAKFLTEEELKSLAESFFKLLHWHYDHDTPNTLREIINLMFVEDSENAKTVESN